VELAGAAVVTIRICGHVGVREVMALGMRNSDRETERGRGQRQIHIGVGGLPGEGEGSAVECVRG
jgi:hypothetical protein